MYSNGNLKEWAEHAYELGEIAQLLHNEGIVHDVNMTRTKQTRSFWGMRTFGVQLQRLTLITFILNSDIHTTR